MKKILVTGGAGFVGTHLIEHILKNTDWEVVSLDRYDTSGNPNRLSGMVRDTFGMNSPEEKRLSVVYWDLKSPLNDQVIKQLGGPFDYISHLAAGSHVDRSIEDPMGFFMDNCIGTVNLMLYARDHGLKKDLMTFDHPIVGRFHYFSTDEVYGPAPFDSELGFKEWDRLNPNNPYAAAKAAAEMAVISFANTYRIPSFITNTMNIFGERQNPEKFIPLIMNKVLNDEKLLIHANKDRTQAGKRHYLHARNICAASVWLLDNAELLDGSAEKGRYNVVGDVELDNLALAQQITGLVNEWLASKNEPPHTLNYELVDFHSSRPGHDLRYALDGAMLKDAGFDYPMSFEESLRKMVFWTLDHKDKWL